MELLIKVRNKYPKDHPNYLSGWRDCQVIDRRPNGYYKNTAQSLTRKTHCVIRTHHDYWAMRGSIDWKSDQDKIMDFKKFLVPVDRSGKYPWEFGYLEDEERIRCRDWFIDFKALLDAGTISIDTFASIYDPSRNHNDIYISDDLTTYLVHEDAYTRKESIYSNLVNSKEFISTGTFSIGSGLDYDDVAAFEAAIDATLTGNLTGEHADEETAISASVTFDTETAGFLLKLTAASGAKHNGTFGSTTHASGDGARVNYGTSDRIIIDETTNGDMADFEIGDLVLDIQGNSNIGVELLDGGDGGLINAKSLVIKGDVLTLRGIQIVLLITNGRVNNNIIHGIGNSANESGIHALNVASAQNVLVANNTIAKCYENVVMDDNAPAATNYIFKNNLCQGDTGGTDWRDDGAGYGTTGTNVSEDATSPDASYQSKDLHTNSIFNGYATDDYTLDSGGDATNLAIADDGEDLSASFTDDILGNTRSTWYIGASEIVAVVDIFPDSWHPGIERPYPFKKEVSNY